MSGSGGYSSRKRPRTHGNKAGPRSRRSRPTRGGRRFIWVPHRGRRRSPRISSAMCRTSCRPAGAFFATRGSPSSSPSGPAVREVEAAARLAGCNSDRSDLPEAERSLAESDWLDRFTGAETAAGYVTVCGGFNLASLQACWELPRRGSPLGIQRGNPTQSRANGHPD